MDGKKVFFFLYFNNFFYSCSFTCSVPPRETCRYSLPPRGFNARNSARLILLIPIFPPSLAGMGDAPAVVQTARNSLAALNASTTLPSQVNQAEQTLQTIKDGLNPISCIQVVELLLSPLLDSTSHPHFSLAEVHFGFHLLDELILRATTPWAAFPDMVQGRVRQIAVMLFQQLSEVDANGYRVNRFPALALEKTVALLSAVAIREWPQRWKSFMDDLLSDPRRAETSCHVLRVMSEDIYDYPDLIEPKRRQELIHCMALCLPIMLKFVTAAASQFHQQRNYIALNSALQTLQAFVSWASMQSIFSSGVPTACLTLLHDPETRSGALATLTTLVRRQFVQTGNSQHQVEQTDLGKLEVESEVIFRDTIFDGVQQFVATSQLPLLAAMSPLPPSGVSPALLQAFAQPQAPVQIDIEEHEFQVAFFRMLSDLGSTNFFPTFLFSKRKGILKLSSSEYRQGAVFVELMLYAVSGPSSFIRMAALPFFSGCLGAISKQETKKAPLGELAKFLTAGFLNAACLSLIRFPKQFDQFREMYDELDYSEDKREEMEHSDNFTARVISSLGVAARLCPEQAGLPCLQRLASLLSTKSYQTSQTSNMNLKGAVSCEIRSPRTLGFILPDDTQHGWKFGSFDDTSRAAWLAALHGAIVASEAVMSGVTASGTAFERSDMYQVMVQCFMMTMTLNGEALLPLKAQALRVFSPMYQVDAKSLELCFEVLIAQGSNMNSTSASRYKACLAFSVLCKRLGNAGLRNLANYRQPMCEYCSQALRSSQFETINKLLLLEASIATILVLDNVDEQSVYIEQLMNPILEFLSSDFVKSILGSPLALYNFIDSSSSGEVSRFCEAFQLLETGAHQVARLNAKSHVCIQIPNALSRSIAPQLVEIGSTTVKALHGLYNSVKFPLDDVHQARKSTLQPSSRDLTSLLNLESHGAYWMGEIPQEFVRIEDGQNRGRSAEQRGNDTLLQYGIDPPDPQHGFKRETLKNMRRSAYEILRAAVLSGVTSSITQIQTFLEATTADCSYVEPIHLVELTMKLMKPLLSFPVVSANSAYLNSVASSGVPKFLQIIREHVENAKLGEIVDSEGPLLDVARDYGRKSLARCAADMLSAMYPREQKDKEAIEAFIYIPTAFNFNSLGHALIAVWKAICNSERGALDSGAANVGLLLIITAVGMAPLNAFPFFRDLLETSLNTAIQNSGLSQDSPLNSAIGAILAIMRKWPTESEEALRFSLLQEGEKVSEWVSECVGQIAGGHSKSKKHRSLVRELVYKISAHVGLSEAPKATVKVLPEKLRTNNPARSTNRRREELEDVILGDYALDSLFGDGGPL